MKTFTFSSANGRPLVKIRHLEVRSVRVSISAQGSARAREETAAAHSALLEKDRGGDGVLCIRGAWRPRDDWLEARAGRGGGGSPPPLPPTERWWRCGWRAGANHGGAPARGGARQDTCRPRGYAQGARRPGQQAIRSGITCTYLRDRSLTRYNVCPCVLLECSGTLILHALKCKCIGFF